jgi:hypothetical protein
LQIHKGKDLTSTQVQENRASIHGAWRKHAQAIRHAMRSGIYRGWDLHPAQLPARFAVAYDFFLSELALARPRLAATSQATSGTSVSSADFDDNASASGLRQFVQRGIRLGALEEKDLKT